MVGAGARIFDKLEPEPHKNEPAPQHCGMNTNSLLNVSLHRAFDICFINTVHLHEWQIRNQDPIKSALPPTPVQKIVFEVTVRKFKNIFLRTSALLKTVLSVKNIWKIGFQTFS
jgi:hypothetical protein